MSLYFKALLFLTIALSAVTQSRAEISMTVYKTPSCGCCAKWVDHLIEAGIKANTIALSDLAPIKSKYNIERRFRSCHTGLVVTEQGQYVFEGHVPKEHIESFLANPPEGALGLAVPGMPIGSPGMEVGERRDYYQVLLLNADGSSSIYAHVNQ